MNSIAQLRTNPRAKELTQPRSKPSPSAVVLGESQRLETVGRLVGGVAHDFNNLLTGIVLCCDLLRAGLNPDKLRNADPGQNPNADHLGRLRHYADEIRIASVQGTALIQQLLAVARPSVVELHAVSLNEVITGMRNLLARLIGEDIELVFKLASDLSPVRMDPAQAQQIIMNLVLNARDAMPEGGQVTLVTRNCKPSRAKRGKPRLVMRPYVELAVSDTGCGMDAETRFRLFEPFFTTKAPGQGNGLGLATVHTIVKQDGGAIEVESAPAQGTRIVVHLPAAPADSIAEETGSALAEALAASTRKVPRRKFENRKRGNQT